MEILTTANRHRLSTISIAPNFADVPTFEGFWILGNRHISVVRTAIEIRRCVEKFVHSSTEKMFTHDVNIVLPNGNSTNHVLRMVVDHPFRQVTAGSVEMSRFLEDLRTVFLPIMLFIWGTFELFRNLFRDLNSHGGHTKKVLVSAYSRSGAERAHNWLPSEIRSHEKTEIIEDRRAPDFDKWHRRKKESLEKTYNVEVKISTQNEIVISGFGTNPSNARREVEALLGKCPEPGVEIAAWQRVSKDDRLSFSQTACTTLERAFERREPIARIEDHVSDGDYEVKYDVKLSEMFGNGNEDEPTLQRVAKPNDNPDLPNHWEQMGKTPVGIPIPTRGDEFKKVANILSQRGGHFRIIHIERIQNRSLYIQYKAKMEEVSHKHMYRSNVEIERVLFHGTSAESTESILKHGFNRSYSGKNATLFGHGTYFATDPKVAHKYAAKAEGGSRKLFMANVLTGMFTKGSEKVRVLPKIKGTFDHYDSLVDDEANPKKFVVFHDAAAYPSYLIKYKV